MNHTQAPSSISFVKLFMKGREIAAEEHVKNEKNKIGTLRGGSSGALVGNMVLGKCARLSLARFKGLQEPHDDHTHTIFESGYANEEVWMSKLRLAWSGEVTGDAAFPLSWQIDGRTVSGRPDIILKDESGVAVAGAELKVVESIQSATSLYFECKPKTDNLIQAAHYSLKFGLPWSLIYTFSGVGSPPYWAIKKFDLPKGTMVRPFKLEFKLFWQDGTLGYLTPDGESVMTIVTEQSINDYFQLVSEMERENDLFLRHPSLDLQGKFQGFNSCDYCSLRDQCDNFERHGNVQLWLDEVAREWNNK